VGSVSEAQTVWAKSGQNTPAFIIEIPEETEELEVPEPEVPVPEPEELEPDAPEPEPSDDNEEITQTEIQQDKSDSDLPVVEPLTAEEQTAQVLKES
jgi:hypothetical protein